MAGFRNRAVTTTVAAMVFAGAALGQADSAAQIREVDRGRAAYAAGDWATLADAAGKVMAANPWHGEAHAGYGHAMVALGRPSEAVEALERALAIGYRPATVQYNLACAHAKLGETAEAMAWLEGAIDARFSDWGLLARDTDLDSLRGEARFQELLGTPPDGLTREQRWAHDMDFLAWRMERLHYDLYAKVSREEFRGGLDSLKARVGSLDDAGVMLELQKLIARVGDGHTEARVFGRGSPVVQGRYPVGLYWYEDGLFVRAAGQEHAGLVGARVLAIGGVESERVLKMASEYICRDNEMGVRDNAPFMLSFRPVATAMGLAEADGSLRLRVETQDGQRTESVLVPGFGPPDSVVRANATATKPVPRYLAHARETFGFEPMPEHRAVYAWINQIADSDNETMSAFVERLFGFIDANGVEVLIIDVRGNGGGNNYLNAPLVRAVTAHDRLNRPGGVFVITGRQTYSAAVDLLCGLTRHSHALVVGEPAKAGTRAVGEPRSIELPCSKLVVRCSTLLYQHDHPMEQRGYIWTDLPAPCTSRDFAENRDPALEAILSFLDSERGEPIRAGERAATDTR